ncbi:ribonuclease E/G [Caulobacter sp. KR2-114]|uniref:ribonuclease E/G n=1 Tax=Caulobacter sp. KR2-114 TaxID=3400912 RepID=UPI003C0CD9BF
MSERRLYLDAGIGETRGVVTLDGRPERLLIDRGDVAPAQALGARLVARVRKLERAQALAFLDLGAGPDGVLNLRPEMERFAEGQALEVEVRSEGRADKGPNLRLIGPAQGAPRVLEAAPDLAAQLQAFAPRGQIVAGEVARRMADEAQDEALQTVFPLPGGGTVAIERTRALTAVDVDMGARPGAEAKRAARQANQAALATVARVLRLKGLGGLVVIDLAGRGHDGPTLLSTARTAFGPDNPGVALGPISRFGTLELTVPRRSRPAVEQLADASGAPTALTAALALIRALEREAAADGGARLEAVAAGDVAEAAAPYLKLLIARVGARVTLRAEPGRARSESSVRAL